MSRINKRKVLKKLWYINLLVYLLTSCQQEEKIDKYAIYFGKFEASVTETGDLQAVNAYTLIAPDVRRFGRQLLVIKLVEHGKEVKKGELVVQFDPSDIMNFIIEQQSTVDVEIANLNKLYAQHESKKKELNAQLLTAEANFEMKKLELDKFQFESEKKKEVKKLEFEQAKIRLENIKRKIELEKNIEKNELKIQKIKIEQRKINIQNANEAKEMLNLYAENDGIAQIGTNWRNGRMIRLGDDIYRGNPVVYIPDVTKMKVKSRVNETDILKIKTGQEVIVRLDAYPNQPFHGEVTDIGKLSYPKDRNSKIKVFDVEILIKESNPSLKPGMTVSCEFLYANYDKAFYISNECIEKNTDGYYIYKKTSSGYEKQKVKIGSRNNFYTVLLGNFKEGARLIPIANININDETKI